MGNMRRTIKAPCHKHRTTHCTAEHMSHTKIKMHPTVMYIYNIPIHYQSMYTTLPNALNRAAGIQSYIISNLASLPCCNKNPSPYIQTPPMISHSLAKIPTHQKIASCLLSYLSLLFIRKWGSRFASAVQWLSLSSVAKGKENQKAT